MEEEKARATWSEESRDVCCSRRVGVDMLQVPFMTMSGLEVEA